jgi:hypothetical protein
MRVLYFFVRFHPHFSLRPLVCLGQTIFEDAGLTADISIDRAPAYAGSVLPHQFCSIPHHEKKCQELQLLAGEVGEIISCF